MFDVKLSQLIIDRVWPSTKPSQQEQGTLGNGDVIGQSSSWIHKFKIHSKNLKHSDWVVEKFKVLKIDIIKKRSTYQQY